MKTAFYLLFFLSVTTLSANNIMVSNVSLTGQQPDQGLTQIEFDLSWENSWRLSVGPANWDAAWVFAKFRVNSGEWQHCSVFGTDTPAGVTADIYEDRGAMIYRATDGSGSVDWENIQLQWSYDDDGVGTNDIVDVQVFAVEMVYVPEGAFWLGSSADGLEREVNSFYEFGAAPAGQFTAYRVTSESPINIGTANGSLYYSGTSVAGGDRTGSLSALYPKGFAAFYAMKYEVTEDQWVAYFNALTPTQQLENDLTDANGKNTDAVVSRNTIAWDGSGEATTITPNVAVNFVSVAQLLAYLDWAALRPMSELEFEKAARGPLAPVDGEFAWGNASIHATDYILSNEGTPASRVSNPGSGTGNALYNMTDGDIGGPIRTGIFAASAGNASREETGGSYYGIMELSGNLYERPVTVGTNRGRLFRGTHGNGSLTAGGLSDVSFWPDGTSGDGMSFRGASWLNASVFLRTADRFDGASLIIRGNSRLGFRGVRTAQ